MSPQVLCLGECLIDRIFHRYDKNHNDTDCWEDYPGGAPANVAAGLVKLGIPAGFIGCIGQDKFGEQLSQTLTLAGVDCSYLQSSAEAPTRVVLVQRNEQGERHFIGFSQPSIDGYADTLLNPEQLPLRWFAAAKVVVMGTLGLAYPDSSQSMHRALQLARQHRATVVIDVNWRPVFWPDPPTAPDAIEAFIRQADIVKFSEEEAAWLFQTTDAGQILKQLERPNLVLITAGAAGCWYATTTTVGKVPAFDVACEDTTGAGDAFLAGLIHHLAQASPDHWSDGHWLQGAIRYASAVGALTTLRSGAMTAQPNLEEVDAFLYLQP